MHLKRYAYWDTDADTLCSDIDDCFFTFQVCKRIEYESQFCGSGL
ncbi:hypothetical protein D083_3942 [Dickeya solani RNS 08.23.3.1.A]|nr:hypothetical protein D083_3942 [Dickeya solani RNS 08.23.3.1.A]